MASKIKIQHSEPTPTTIKNNSETFQTSLSENMSSDTAQAVINWATNYTNLTKDTYEFTRIEETKSIIEIINN